MKIGICDDELLELMNTKTIVENFIASKQSNIITLNLFKNGEELLSFIDRYGSFDLLILDILMPGMNGIDLAYEIREKNSDCKIIFLTSSPEFAVNSYKVDAFYYLLKPISVKELETLLNKALSLMEEEKCDSIVIKENGRLTRVQIHSIQYIESIKHSIYFHLKNNEVLSCYRTINEFSEILLSDKRFVRCHKSFIINMDYVISISSKDFVMSDKTLIPISRQIYQQVKNTYIDFFFKEGNYK